MFFASPWWLLALAPWLALTMWLLRGRRRRVNVPFVQLWRAPVPEEVARRGFRWPPAWVALAILATLCAILAASKPADRSRRPRASITIIVDRGITMSIGKKPRFQEAADLLDHALRVEIDTVSQVRLIDVPGDQAVTADSQWRAKVSAMPPSALDTRAAIRSAARNALDTTSGPVLVISDATLNTSDARLVQCAPPWANDAVLIARIAARDHPTPQIMVELLNESARQDATIRIIAPQPMDKTVALPPLGGRQTYFIDLPNLSDRVEASVVQDNAPANDHAWLVRGNTSPRIELQSIISPALQRLIELYGQERPPSENSTVLSIVGSINELPADRPGIVVASASRPIVSDRPVIGPGPITEHFDPAAMDGQKLRIADNSPPGWEPLISSSGYTLVAIRPGPARAVWVGFDSDTWARTPGFVVFWASVLDWAGQGNGSFGSANLSQYRPGFQMMTRPTVAPTPLAGQWPGIYQTNQGNIVALNAPVVQISALPPINLVDSLQRALSGAALYRPFSRILLLLAVFLGAAALIAGKRINLTPFGAGRTF